MSNESKKTLLTDGVVTPTMQKVIVNNIEKGVTMPNMQPVSPMWERGATVPTMQPAPNASVAEPAQNPTPTNQTPSSGTGGTDKK